MGNAVYRIEAYNTAKHSENKIHDDSVAQRFGFTGGLVPGVDVYAYMTHAAVARWGRAWLERGTLECRFGKPVYDGEIAIVTPTDSAEGMLLMVESQGASCASGSASLPLAVEAVDLAAWPLPPEPPQERPAADAVSLAAGRWLGINPVHVTAEFAAQYYADVRETAAIYRDEGLIHPGTVLRTCNWALTHNAALGPWIHVGSRVVNLAAGRVGETLTVRARIARNYEHKGHLFVDLDALVLADAKPVAHVIHTAIYRPRQVMAA